MNKKQRDIKSMARLVAALWDDKKAKEWAYGMDRDDVYGVVLLLKENGLDIAASALDDTLEQTAWKPEV